MTLGRESIRFVPAAVVLLAFLFPLHGEEEGDPALEEKLVLLKEEIYSINLIDRLDLDADQVAVILKQSRLARPYFEAGRKMIREIRLLQLTAFREFKAEDELNRGFTREVELNAARTDHLEKEIRDRVIAKANQLSVPVYEKLTLEQLGTIEGYKPFLFPQEHRDREMVKKSDRRWSTVARILETAHSLSPKRYRRDRDEMVKDIFNQLPRPVAPKSKGRGKKGAKEKSSNASSSGKTGGLPLETGEAARERIGRVLDDVRELSAQELERTIDQIIEFKLLASEAQWLVRDMGKIARSKHEQLCNVARYLLNPEVIDYLAKMKPKKGGAGVAGKR